jgi:hypothetical protein
LIVILHKDKSTHTPCLRSTARYSSLKNLTNLTSERSRSTKRRLHSSPVSDNNHPTAGLPEMVAALLCNRDSSFQKLWRALLKQLFFNA